GSGAAHLHVCADQRHTALRARAGQPGLAGGAAGRSRARGRAATLRGPADLPAGRGRPSAAGHPGQRGAQLTTLAGAVDRYLDHLTVERGLAAHTLQAYRRDLLRYQAALATRGRTAIGQVTTHDVAH